LRIARDGGDGGDGVKTVATGLPIWNEVSLLVSLAHKCKVFPHDAAGRAR